MKVAIIGGCAKKSDGVLELGREWHIWGVNACWPEWLMRSYIRLDKWFHLHRRAELKDEIPEHLEAFEKWCLAHDEIEIVLLEMWENLPKATIFPRDEVRRIGRGDYHCGSFDWMVAYAILLGVEEIYLAGIKLHTESGEPQSSGPCLEYWCGFAEARGIKITTSPSCDLFYNWHLVKSHYVYGYDKWDLIEDRTAAADAQVST